MRRRLCGADRDGDGHIEPKEIKTVMGNIGVHVSDEKASAIIASVDTDGNGMVRGTLGSARSMVGAGGRPKLWNE